MAACNLSHNNTIPDIIKNHGMQIFAESATYIGLHYLVAKLLKSETHVAAAVGATTSLGFHAICIIDHRYAQNDDQAHGIFYRIARALTLFFVNVQVIKYFSRQGHPISTFWAFTSVAIPFYMKEIEILNYHAQGPDRGDHE
ncbi:MAG: hypothetical protein AB7N99_00570 [Simkaniaceae bacterium]|jgi:hypothetical protein